MKYQHGCLLVVGIFLATQPVFARAWPGCDTGIGCTPGPRVPEPPPPTHLEKFWKVAVIQCNEACHPLVCVGPKEAEHIKAINRADLDARIRQAAQNGAKIIVTPEFGIVGYPEHQDEWESREQIQSYVEPFNGRSTQYFSDLAAKLHVYIQVGFAEVGKNGRYYNAAVVLGPNGKIVAHHRKNCLFTGEPAFLESGNEITIYKTPVGKIGVAICMDILGCENPPLPRYKAAGVKILTVSSSWAAGGAMEAFQAVAQRWHFYFLGSNQSYFPGAGVINPDGTAQSVLHTDGIAYGYLPLETPAARQKPK